MICPSCGHDNAAGARFCGRCGYSFPGAEASGPDAVYIPRRDLGELISETFKIYRQDFWPFIGIALVAMFPNLISAFVSPVSFPGTDSLGDDSDYWRPFGSNDALGLVFLVVGLFTSAWAAGAAACAVAQHQLGRPVQLDRCLAKAWKKIGVLLLALLLFIAIMIGSGLLVVLLIGIPLFFYLLVALFFYIPAIMLEQKDVTGSLGRSRQLVTGNWWRVFGIGIVFVLLIIGISIVLSIPASIVPYAGPILLTIINILVFPIAAIGSTLVYIDLRVRKEDYSRTQMVYELDRLG